MIEIVALALLTLSIGACFFSKSHITEAADKLQVPEDSTLRRHFLTHLRSQDIFLAAELERRLASSQR